MTLADRCSTRFEKNDRSRGNSYYYARRVELLECHHERVSAAVRGSEHEPYSVHIDWSRAAQREVEASCTCPRYQDGFLCKHIWAAMLAVDAKGLASSLRGTSRLHVAHEFDLVDDESADDIDVEPIFSILGKFLSPGFRKVMDARRARPTRKGPDWRQQLSPALNPSANREPFGNWREVADKRREAWFVLNVGDSLGRGNLAIEFCQREENKNGAFGKIKRLALRRQEPPAFADPQDGRLLQLLLGNDLQTDASSHSYYYSSSVYSDLAFSRCVLSPAWYEQLLPLLCGTGRFVWILDSRLPIEEGRPLAWDDGPPWQFQLRLDPDEAKRCWHVTGWLQRGEQSVPLSDAVLLLAHGLVVFPDRLARLDARNNFAWISALRQSPTIEVPFADRDEWLTRLWSNGQVPQLELPENLRLEQVRLEPLGKLSVKAPERYTNDNTLYADIAFVYGDQEVEPDDSGAGRVDVEQQRVLVRSLAGEEALLRQLAAEGLRPPPYYYHAKGHLQFPKRRLPELVQKLVSQGWVVESEGRRVRRPGQVNLSVTSGIDWFELDGTVDFEGVTASLPQLLAALRNNEKYVRLDDGSHGMMPEEWLQRYGGLAQLGKADGEAVKFAPSQALLLDALLSAQETQDQVRVDQQFAAFREKLRSFDGIQPHEASADFTGQLRGYQQEGLGWLNFLREFRFGGCLADDMGLGKTVQVLALLDARRTRTGTPDTPQAPSIVIVPKSLVFNWIDEAARFTPQLRVLNFTGLGRADAIPNLDQYDLVVTTYGTLRRDIVTLKDVRFDYAILDESQAIKNANSQAAKACRLLNADHRLAMTGTPIENHLGELWSLFEFLNPGMLGQSTAFQTLTKSGLSDDGQALPLLAKALRPFLLRRTKEQVLKELPVKTEQTLYCEMEPKQRKLYDSLRDYYRASLSQKVEQVGLNRAKIHVLEALLRLRQAACHPGLIDDKKQGEPSAKLELLCEQIQEVLDEGHKALVFSQFTSLLDIVRQRFDKLNFTYEYLDGQTRDRKARVQRFQQDPDCPLFLISLKAGGHGLNLTAADYVFILDPWWNPAVEAQAIDRTHRIGQTRRVFAYRIICRDTVEDKILELQRTKRALADAIVSANNSVIRNLTADDLQLLLS